MFFSSRFPYRQIKRVHKRDNFDAAIQIKILWWITVLHECLKNNFKAAEYNYRKMHNKNQRFLRLSLPTSMFTFSSLVVHTSMPLNDMLLAYAPVFVCYQCKGSFGLPLQKLKFYLNYVNWFFSSPLPKFWLLF